MPPGPWGLLSKGTGRIRYLIPKSHHQFGSVALPWSGRQVVAPALSTMSSRNLARPRSRSRSSPPQTVESFRLGPSRQQVKVSKHPLMSMRPLILTASPEAPKCCLSNSRRRCGLSRNRSAQNAAVEGRNAGSPTAPDCARQPFQSSQSPTSPTVSAGLVAVAPR